MASLQLEALALPRDPGGGCRAQVGTLPPPAAFGPKHWVFLVFETDKPAGQAEPGVGVCSPVHRNPLLPGHMV